MAEPTTAHTEVPGAPHKAPFPPFERDTFPSQLFWLAICFIVLYVMTARLVRPRVGGIIASRGDHIAGDLAEAGRLKSESEAAMAAYEKALADARARAPTNASETPDKLQAEAKTAAARPSRTSSPASSPRPRRRSRRPRTPPWPTCAASRPTPRPPSSRG